MSEYISDGIPVISKEAYKSVEGIMGRDFRMGNLDKICKDLYPTVKSNPMYFKILSDLSKEDVGEKFHEGVGFGLMFAHKLVTQQTGANMLRENLDESEAIPVISLETYVSLANVIARDIMIGNHDKVKEDFYSLGEINPMYILILDGFLEQDVDEESLDGIAFGLNFAYKLITQQTEANKLEKDFK